MNRINFSFYSYIGDTLYFQVKELVQWVKESNADFVVLGGDFNTDPKDKETSYHDLKEAMISSMEEFFINIKVSNYYQNFNCF